MLILDPGGSWWVFGGSGCFWVVLGCSLMFWIALDDICQFLMVLGCSWWFLLDVVGFFWLFWFHLVLIGSW